jgi:hypothetical protein
MSAAVAVLSVLAAADDAAHGEHAWKVVEIARGHSWVSPYWGYNTPKVVCDGTCYYTAGLWGATPNEAEGVVYKYESGAWRKGAALTGIYQPATLLLDREKRLIVAYTRKDKPARFLRSQTPGNVDVFEELPAPPDMVNAYYIGIAIRDKVVHLAYLVDPANAMYLTRLDLESLTWSASAVIQEGQVERKPKTAWTYPILLPSNTGLHFVASNCPDGSEGNTYNQVWYLFYPRDSKQPTVREQIAECQIGHTAYAMDMITDAAERVHVIYMWNHHVYGEPLPVGAPEEGTYHAVRDPQMGEWARTRVGNLCISGLYRDNEGVLVVMQTGGALAPARWRAVEQRWREGPPLCHVTEMPAAPGFMDILSTASGSDMGPGLAVVCDGVLAGTNGQRDQRVLWSLLPVLPRQ